MSDGPEKSTAAIMNTLALAGDAKSTLSPEKLMAVNSLRYALTPQLSCVERRTVERTPYTSNNYGPGTVMSITLPSGPRFFNADNCYLQGSIWSLDGGTNVTQAYLGSNGIYGCFQASVATSAGGKELCRVDNYLNYWNQVENVSGGNYHDAEKVMALMPVVDNATYDFDANTDRTTVTGQVAIYKANSAAAVPFRIPLSRLFPLFKTDMPIPHILASGLRLDITLAPTAVACKGVAGAGLTGTVTDYQIVNPVIITDNLWLTDAFLGAVTKQAATAGLEFEITGLSQTQFTVAATTASLQTQRAYTHCKSVWLQQVDTAAGGDESKVDSFTNASNPVTSFQFRVGSSYYPNQPCVALTTTDAMSKIELYTLGYLYPSRCQKDTHLKYLDWSTTNCLLVADLQRAINLSHSGVGLSNAKNITVDLALANSTSRSWIMWIQYSVVMQIFSDGNVVVRS